MDVEMCDIILVLYERPVDTLGREGSLVNAHGIGKRASEDIVVADCNLRQDIRKRACFFCAEMGQRGYMPLVWQYWSTVVSPDRDPMGTTLPSTSNGQ